MFDEDVRPWEGAALTTLVDEFEDLDGSGHGVKIEAMSMMPAMYIPLYPW